MDVNFVIPPRQIPGAWTRIPLERPRGPARSHGVCIPALCCTEGSALYPQPVFLMLLQTRSSEHRGCLSAVWGIPKPPSFSSGEEEFCSSSEHLREHHLPRMAQKSHPGQPSGGSALRSGLAAFCFGRGCWRLQRFGSKYPKAPHPPSGAESGQAAGVLEGCRNGTNFAWSCTSSQIPGNYGDCVNQKFQLCVF